MSHQFVFTLIIVFIFSCIVSTCVGGGAIVMGAL